MSIFEVIMLACFGAAWPLTIHKSYKSKQIAGKSITFHFVIFFGYIAGILHKLIYNLDYVIYLYILNTIMVSVAITIYYKNKFSLRNIGGVIA